LGRGITCIFIIVSIVYVGIGLTKIINELKEKIPETLLKTQVTNGIVIVGKFNKSLAVVSREVLPQEIEIAYIVTESIPSDAAEINKDKTTFTMRSYP